MDREDARFVISALESRISGDRAELDRLAAADVLRLAAAASRLKRLGADWPPAHTAAAELDQIALYGGSTEASPATIAALNKFVDKFRALVAEPVAPRNRAERRAQIARLPRKQRLQFVQPARLVH